jgi:hypothetical protein
MCSYNILKTGLAKGLHNPSDPELAQKKEIFETLTNLENYNNFEGLDIEDFQEIYDSLLAKLEIQFPDLDKSGYFLYKAKSHKVKKMVPIKFPKILTVHIQRVSMTPYGDIYKENSALVFEKNLNLGFLGKSLDLKPGQRQELRSQDYELCAAVSHLGNAEGGHYICAKNNWVRLGTSKEDGECKFMHTNWTVVSDTESCYRDFDFVRNNVQAYILVYQRS